MDLLQYFKSCTLKDQKGVIAVGTQLYRAGIADMELLCGLLEQSPEKVSALRNIGEKRLALARAVCSLYRREQAIKPLGGNT